MRVICFRIWSITLLDGNFSLVRTEKLLQSVISYLIRSVGQRVGSQRESSNWIFCLEQTSQELPMLVCCDWRYLIVHCTCTTEDARAAKSTNANIAGVGVKLVLGKLLTLMTMCSTHIVIARVYFTCLSKIGQKSTGGRLGWWWWWKTNGSPRNLQGKLSCKFQLNLNKFAFIRRPIFEIKLPFF